MWLITLQGEAKWCGIALTVILMVGIPAYISNKNVLQRDLREINNGHYTFAYGTYVRVERSGIPEDPDPYRLYYILEGEHKEKGISSGNYLGSIASLPRSGEGIVEIVMNDGKIYLLKMTSDTKTH